MNHSEVVKKLIESKTVDFAAVGKFIADHGATMAMSDDPWDKWCGTGPRFLHFYRLPGFGPQIPREGLSNLANLSSEIR